MSESTRVVATASASSSDGVPIPPLLPRWVVPVAGVVVFVGAGVVLVALWTWIDRLPLVDAERKAGAQLDAIKIAASVLVAGGGLFALYLAARRQRTQEQELRVRHAELRHREAELAQRDRAQDDTRQDAEARRITELYTKAGDQLGSDKAPVRLAGLYAFERLAQDNPDRPGLRQTVVEVLCAYLRMPYTPPEDQPDEAPERRQELEVRRTAQRILSLHLHPGPDPDKPVPTFWSDTDLDLTGATLVGFDLTGCRFRGATFDRTSFRGQTRFEGTRFGAGARFARATFAGPARFAGATFEGDARFDDATFSDDARFNKATYGGKVWFDGAAFAADTRFDEVVFTGYSRFHAVSFGGDVRFDRTSFADVAWFFRASFEGGVRFDKAEFSGGSSFAKATFAGHARFGRAPSSGSASFEEVVLSDPFSLLSEWPPGWRTGDVQIRLDHREGTWRRLVRSGDDHQPPAPRPSMPNVT
ncbi:MAG: pentapeptide repeat-containing protein [Saccharothrix sp.]|nr:pentapeptide repeat-containing protein [Saccharothrix sp.]